MEKNGRASCTGRSRHIHIKYSFIKDVLENEDITLEHCPTEKIIADFYTKPLQGRQFRKLRDIIMGIVSLPSEERVEVRSGQADGKMTSEIADFSIGGKDVMELRASGVNKSSTGEVNRTGMSSLTYADMTRRNMNGDKNEIDEMDTILIK